MIKKTIIFLSALLLISGFTYLYFWFSTPPAYKLGSDCYKTKMNELKICPRGNNYAPIAALPSIFVDAVIFAEDAGFYNHSGFDKHEIIESFKVNIVSGSYKRGGSTISQQTAKNLFLTKEKSLIRKIHELFLTIHLEETYNKRKILETYLNIAEFGKNIFGVQAASQKHFFSSAQELSLFQSVYLAHLLPSPKKLERAFFEVKYQKESIFRMNIIAQRLRHYKKISETEFNILKSQISALYMTGY